MQSSRESFEEQTKEADRRVTTLEKQIVDLEENLIELSEENADLLNQIRAINLDKEDALKNVRLLEDQLEFEKQDKMLRITAVHQMNESGSLARDLRGDQQKITINNENKRDIRQLEHLKKLSNPFNDSSRFDESMARNSNCLRNELGDLGDIEYNLPDYSRRYS